MKSRTLGLIAAFLASSALMAAAPPTGLEWSVNSALTHTDNVTLVETSPVSENIGSVGGMIDFSREGPRLDASLRGDGNYLDYFENTYSSEFLGSVAASLQFRLIGDALTWSLDNTFGQSITNEFEPPTPDNRGNVNNFSTGPDLRLRLGGPNEFFLGARYEASSYEEAGSSDSHSWTGNAAAIHRVSPSVAWSLHARTSRVEYDTTGTPSYDQSEFFVRLESKREGQELTADLGAALLDGSGGTEQKPVIRVNWMRRLTPSWKLDLGVGSGFRNSGQQFADGVAGGAELGGTQDVILTDQAHRYDTANVSLTFDRPRTTLSLTGGADRERFPDSSDLDRDSWSVGAEASRRITERLRATLNVGYETRNFEGSFEDDNTTTFTLGIDWRLGKALFLGMQGGTQSRSGDTDFGYDETVYQVSLSYQPWGY